MHQINKMPFLSLALTVSLTLLLGLPTAWASGESELKELRKKTQTTIIQMRSSQPKAEKLAFLKQSKTTLELELKKLIVDGKADPADLKSTKSELSLLFRGLDLLTALAQLETDEAGQIDEISCSEARSLIVIGNYQPVEPASDLGEDEKKVIALINDLCQK